MRRKFRLWLLMWVIADCGLGAYSAGLIYTHRYAIQDTWLEVMRCIDARLL
jgi:hypothetical protein